ncbi:unnamed protein product [Leptosia nina]|uniref:SHSP domain-containing protein n=1 Tax=Leptosia nina TaxID=320188 RepID=A0AAV1ITC2_9NEOP
MMLRKILIATAFLVAANAFPAQKTTSLILDESDEKSSWYSTFPLFSIFKPIIELFPNFADIGPKIEIGEKYTNIIIKADQYKLEELSVVIKGRYVSIEGSKRTVNDDRDLASEFLYTASLPHNADKSDVFAKFYSDKYLVVSTPNKAGKESNHVDRTVPIEVIGEPYIKNANAFTENQSTGAPVLADLVSTIAPGVIDDKVTSEPESTTEQVTTLAPKLSEKLANLAPQLSTEAASTFAPEENHNDLANSTPELAEKLLETTEVRIEKETTLAPETTSEKAEVVTEEKTVEIVTEVPIEPSTVDFNTASDLEAEKETKVNTESTTPFIEMVTLNTTPYFDNEISDLVSSEQ